jgi:EKC/KEOPS complex subunit CGI121/TPRKB
VHCIVSPAIPNRPSKPSNSKAPADRDCKPASDVTSLSTALTAWAQVEENMAHVKTFTLPHYEGYPVQVALFKHVSNAAFLRSQLLAANAEFDYAFLDASMVWT